MNRARAKVAGITTAVLAAVAAAVAAGAAAVVATRWVRLGFSGARFAVRLGTLRAYRRCPSCYRVVRREARVCRSCGGVTRPAR